MRKIVIALFMVHGKVELLVAARAKNKIIGTDIYVIKFQYYCCEKNINILKVLLGAIKIVSCEVKS